jgi:hypothetical protein
MLVAVFVSFSYTQCISEITEYLEVNSDYRFRVGVGIVIEEYDCGY